ncbi:MAG: Hint domain-containing protein [Pseudomonadota bacterium]
MTVQLRANAQTLTAQAIPVAALPGSPRKGGFAAGTPILTAHGPRAVETLSPGDRIVTRERGLVLLVARDVLMAPAASIHLGQLGPNRPNAPVTLAMSQHIALRAPGTGATILTAEHLGTTKAAAEVPLHRLDLGAPLTVYAAGLEAPTGHAAPGPLTLPH